MPQRREELSLTKGLGMLSETLAQQARINNIYGYKPHEKQKLFHQSEDYLRLFLGGNRSGKTHGAVVEDIWWATGTHPFIATPPPPVRIRVVTVDLVDGLNEIMIPKFKSLCRPQDLKGGSWDRAFSKYERKLTFKNGSEIQFLTYEMDLEKFAGTSQHAIHFDEEPPKHIYNECAARVIDTNGRLWISMTPVEGISWVYDDIYQPTFNSIDKETLLEGSADIGPVYRSPERETFIAEVGMNENPHLPAAAQERYLRTLDPEERAARSKGTFVAVGGKVFKDFTRDSHVIPQIANVAEKFKGWQIYTSTDHGWNNPTAWLWHAVSPQGDVITFWEHYKSEMTIAEHSSVVRAIEKSLGITVEYRTGDPAMKQTSAVSGTSILQEYASHDLSIYTDSVPRDPMIGIAKMAQYFRPLGREIDENGHVVKEGKPTWLITENCVNFIKELMNLQWDKYDSRKTAYKYNKKETVKKKDDHAFDSAKYFATFLPDLRPDPVIVAFERPDGYASGIRYDEALLRATEAAIEKQNQQIVGGWEIVETFN